MTACAAKCPDCEGCDHHYRPLTDYRDGPEDMEYACVHCPARGVTCPDCEGLGTVSDPFDDKDDDGFSLDEECPTCQGWGIIEQITRQTPTPNPRRKGRGSP